MEPGSTEEVRWLYARQHKNPISIGQYLYLHDKCKWISNVNASKYGGGRAIFINISSIISPYHTVYSMYTLYTIYIYQDILHIPHTSKTKQEVIIEQNRIEGSAIAWKEHSCSVLHCTINNSSQIFNNNNRHHTNHPAHRIPSSPCLPCPAVPCRAVFCSVL